MQEDSVNFPISTKDIVEIVGYKDPTTSDDLLLKLIDLTKMSINGKHPLAFAQPGISIAEKSDILSRLKAMLSGVECVADAEYLDMQRNRLNIMVLENQKRHSRLPWFYKRPIWWRGIFCYPLKSIINGFCHSAETKVDTEALYVAIEQAIVTC